MSEDVVCHVSNTYVTCVSFRMKTNVAGCVQVPEGDHFILLDMADALCEAK
jgi:hypothetical protein